MQLAIIKGRATSTVRHPSMRGQKLLLAMQLDSSGRPDGDPVLVIDQLGAGVGDKVMISSDGQGVAERLSDRRTPVRWFTLGVID